jgi:hypothetical protein
MTLAQAFEYLSAPFACEELMLQEQCAEIKFKIL